jgi:hypothetical protein
MSQRRFLSTLLFSALPALPAIAAAPPPAAPAPPAAKTPAAYHRIELKPSMGPTGARPLPYTIEVPEGWQPRQEQGFPGLWIGPPDAKIPDDARLIFVRGSMAEMDDVAKVAANIRANDAADATWSAPLVAVKDLGGVRGLLVRMDRKEGNAVLSTLTLKMPLDTGAKKLSVDFIASATAAEMDRRQAEYERILLSVRPLAAAGETKKP